MVFLSCLFTEDNLSLPGSFVKAEMQGGAQKNRQDKPADRFTYLPKGITYVPKGITYVPKGITYVPKGTAYLPKGSQNNSILTVSK